MFLRICIEIITPLATTDSEALTRSEKSSSTQDGHQTSTGKTMTPDPALEILQAEPTHSMEVIAYRRELAKRGVLAFGVEGSEVVRELEALGKVISKWDPTNQREVVSLASP